MNSRFVANYMSIDAKNNSGARAGFSNFQGVLYFFLVATLWIVATAKLLGADNDYEAYIEYIKNAQYIEFPVFEPGFVLLLKLNFTIFRSSKLIVFGALSGLSLYIKAVAFKKISNYPLYCLILYFFGYYFLHDYTQIRAAVAGALFISSIPNIVKRELLYFSIKLLIASSFHYSALIMIIVYAFVSYIPVRVVIAMPILGLIVYFSGVNILSIIINALSANEFLSFLIRYHTGYVNNINPFNILVSAYYLVFLAGAWILYSVNMSEIDSALFSIISLSIFIYLSLVNSNSPVLCTRVFEFLNLAAVVYVSNIAKYFDIKFPIFLLGVLFFVAHQYHFVKDVWK